TCSSGVHIPRISTWRNSEFDTLLQPRAAPSRATKLRAFIPMKMLARADCFVGSTFHKAGEVFEYDGQPGNAFVRADDDNPPPLITDQQRIDSMLGIKSSQPG